MAQYRKKGGPIEAAQFNGENPMEIVSVVAQTGNFSVNYSPKDGLRFSIGRRHFPIAPGQWVLIEDNRVEVVNDEQFQALYEPANPPIPPTPSVPGVMLTPETLRALQTQPITHVDPNVLWYNNPVQANAYDKSKPEMSEAEQIARAMETGGELVL